jgi:hypothetical protein
VPVPNTGRDVLIRLFLKNLRATIQIQVQVIQQNERYHMTRDLGLTLHERIPVQS